MEQTVNLPAMPTEVRILSPPLSGTPAHRKLGSSATPNKDEGKRPPPPPQRPPGFASSRSLIRSDYGKVIARLLLPVFPAARQIVAEVHETPNKVPEVRPVS